MVEYKIPLIQAFARMRKEQMAVLLREKCCKDKRGWRHILEKVAVKIRNISCIGMRKQLYIKDKKYENTIDNFVSFI